MPVEIKLTHYRKRLLLDENPHDVIKRCENFIPLVKESDMFRNFTILATIAVLAILALSTAAGAQNTPLPPQTINLGTLSPGNRAVPGTSHTSAPAPALVIGWNYVHAENCQSYYSLGTNYLIVYTLEGYYFSTNDSHYQALLSGACQTGNWIAFYIYDSAGDWNQIYTWTYAFKSQY
jgi:hypothetical protein